MCDRRIPFAQAPSHFWVADHGQWSCFDSAASEHTACCLPRMGRATDRRHKSISKTHRRRWNAYQQVSRPRWATRRHVSSFQSTASCCRRQTVIRARRKRLCNCSRSSHRTTTLCAVPVASSRAQAYSIHGWMFAHGVSEDEDAWQSREPARQVPPTPAPQHISTTSPMGRGNTTMPAHTGTGLSRPPAFLSAETAMAAPLRATSLVPTARAS